MATSLLPVEQWQDLFNDTTIVGAALERCARRAHLIKLKSDHCIRKMAKKPE